MKQQPPERTKRLAVIAAAAVILVMVLLIIETFRLLLPGLWTAFSSGDEQALSDYLTSEGRLRSFLTLWFLAVVQVLSLVIPAMPVQLAAGLAYGPWMGFLTSFSASAVANMSVYLLARRLAPVADGSGDPDAEAGGEDECTFKATGQVLDLLVTVGVARVRRPCGVRKRQVRDDGGHLDRDGGKSGGGRDGVVVTWSCSLRFGGNRCADCWGIWCAWSRAISRCSLGDGYGGESSRRMASPGGRGTLARRAGVRRSGSIESGWSWVT
mgnify:CR=1 FL=1